MSPQSLVEIAEIIGRTAALKLSRELGGTEWYISGDMDREHPVVRIIGMEAAAALSHVMAGTDMSIPKNSAEAREQRNAEIRDRVDHGQSTRRIAIDLGMSQRMVRYVIAAFPGNVSPEP